MLFLSFGHSRKRVWEIFTHQKKFFGHRTRVLFSGKPPPLRLKWFFHRKAIHPTSVRWKENLNGVAACWCYSCHSLLHVMQIASDKVGNFKAWNMELRCRLSLNKFSEWKFKLFKNFKFNFSPTNILPFSALEIYKKLPRHWKRFSDRRRKIC